MIGFAAAAFLAAEPSPLPLKHLSNGSFQSGIAGWSLDQQSKDGGFLLAGKNGVARISSVRPPPAGELAIAAQDIEAKPWRGRQIAVAARVRLTGEGAAGLRVLALQDDPQLRMLRTATPNSAVPPDGKWHELRLHGRVGQHADRVKIALYAIGPVTADFDDVRIVPWQAPAQPMSVEARTMLDDAIKFVHENHFNAKDNPEWSALEAQARSDAEGARTREEVEPALTALLGDLGEHHASLGSPQDHQRSAAAHSAPTAQPTVSLADGRFGLVAMPSSGGPDLSDTGPARREVDLVRAELARLDQSPLCGWIVDLRGNSGGTTHYLAAALSGLARFDKKLWPDEYAGDINELPPSLRWLITIEHQQLKQGGKPVAVLVDQRSASAAEAMALRFVGREPTRSFGTRTAGFTSNNAVKDLGEGWLIAVPAGYMHDRLNRLAKDGLTPDEITNDPLPAAEQWLLKQCRA